ncbi:MAG: MerR family transcriptional regulator [Sphingomonadaceae bacterium]
MSEPTSKTASAFRTIGEVSDQFGIARHVLRYWETRFTQLRPLQRSGNRRYYRPEDVALVARINQLLNHEGYTVKGVQALLSPGVAPVTAAEVAPASAPSVATTRAALIAVRDRLTRALAQDDVAARLL